MKYCLFLLLACASSCGYAQEQDVRIKYMLLDGVLSCESDDCLASDVRRSKEAIENSENLSSLDSIFGLLNTTEYTDLSVVYYFSPDHYDEVVYAILHSDSIAKVFRVDVTNEGNDGYSVEGSASSIAVDAIESVVGLDDKTIGPRLLMFLRISEKGGHTISVNQNPYPSQIKIISDVIRLSILHNEKT